MKKAILCVGIIIIIITTLSITSVNAQVTTNTLKETKEDMICTPGTGIIQWNFLAPEGYTVDASNVASVPGYDPTNPNITDFHVRPNKIISTAGHTTSIALKLDESSNTEGKNDVVKGNNYYEVAKSESIGNIILADLDSDGKVDNPVLDSDGNYQYSGGRKDSNEYGIVYYPIDTTDDAGAPWFESGTIDPSDKVVFFYPETVYIGETLVDVKITVDNMVKDYELNHDLETWVPRWVTLSINTHIWEGFWWSDFRSADVEFQFYDNLTGEEIYLGNSSKNNFYMEFGSLNGGTTYEDYLMDSSREATGAEYTRVVSGFDPSMTELFGGVKTTILPGDTVSSEVGFVPVGGTGGETEKVNRVKYHVDTATAGNTIKVNAGNYTVQDNLWWFPTFGGTYANCYYEPSLFTTDSDEDHVQSDTIDILENYDGTLSSSGQTYQVRIQTPELFSESFVYFERFEILDSIPPMYTFDPSTIKVYDVTAGVDSKTDVTSKFIIETSGRAVAAKAKPSELLNPSFYGCVYELWIPVINTHADITTDLYNYKNTAILNDKASVYINDERIYGNSVETNLVGWNTDKTVLSKGVTGIEDSTIGDGVASAYEKLEYQITIVNHSTIPLATGYVVKDDLTNLLADVDYFGYQVFEIDKKQYSDKGYIDNPDLVSNVCKQVTCTDITDNTSAVGGTETNPELKITINQELKSQNVYLIKIDMKVKDKWIDANDLTNVATTCSVLVECIDTPEVVLPKGEMKIQITKGVNDNPDEGYSISNGLAANGDGFAASGEWLNYSIVVANTTEGTVPAQNVIIKDDLSADNGLVLLDVSSIKINSDIDGDIKALCTDSSTSTVLNIKIPTIKVGETITITFKARVS